MINLKLKTKQITTVDALKNIGCIGIKWESADLGKFVKAFNWCNDNYFNSFYYSSKIFWFMNKEIATDFALHWL